MLAPYLSSVIEENLLTGCTLYEPYAGGASISLELLRLGFISDAVLVEKELIEFTGDLSRMGHCEIRFPLN